MRESSKKVVERKREMREKRKMSMRQVVSIENLMRANGIQFVRPAQIIKDETTKDLTFNGIRIRELE